MATWRKTLSSNQYYEVIINVTQTSQNIANNTSNISWNLQVRKTYGSGFWGADNTASTWKVTIDGVDVSSGSGSYDFRGGAPLTKTIASGTRTITHNGDGSRSFGASGYWRDNVNGLGNATATGTMALSTIPRASTLSAFSFSSHLKNGVANTINYTVSRKSGNFRHQIQLLDGSTSVLSWDNISSDGASTITLTASNVNTLLTRMPTSTTKTFTLRVATRSGVGGGWIGSAVARNATATVHADVKPSISGQTFGINDTRIDQTMAKYIQGFTKVDALFTRTAGYGSSIQSSSMTVQKTDGSDSQVISGNVGTTANPVSHSGTYRVIYTTVDERGRKTITSSSHFMVEPYSAPVITDFTLFRYEDSPTMVYVGASGNFSSIGTSNVATLRLERKNGDTWEPVVANQASNTGLIRNEVNVLNNSITSSYEYRATITDLLNRKAESIDTVSTQRVVMDIYRNQGVAFGKMYDTSLGGDVQIGGNVTGGLSVVGKSSFNGDVTAKHGITVLGGGIELGNKNVEFTPYIDFHSSGEHNDYDVRVIVDGGRGNNRSGSANLNILSSNVNMTGRLNTNSGFPTIGQGIVHTGSNNNGFYAKFDNGTMICTFSVGGFGLQESSRNKATWVYPAQFVGSSIGGIQISHSILNSQWDSSGYGCVVNFNRVEDLTKLEMSMILIANKRPNWLTVQLTAIGRWK